MPGSVQSKFEYLVIDNVIAAGELDLATKAARRKNKNIEDVLIEEFQVKPPAIGAALAKFFGVRIRAVQGRPHQAAGPAEEHQARLRRGQPLGAARGRPRHGILVMSTDPERVRNSRMVENVFPRSKVVYKVTTETDFKQTLDQFFGAERGSGAWAANRSATCWSAWTTTRRASSAAARDDVSAAADNELVKLVNKIIVDAYQQGASDIHVEPLPGKGKTGVRFRKDGTLTQLHRGAGRVPPAARRRA